MTPVILLTGFLGSGKTTLLQRLLTDPAMARAAVLINEFGDLETLLARAEEIKQPKRRESLLNNRDQILMSKRLVQLDCDMDYDVSLDDLDVKDPDPAVLLPWLAEMEFRTITKRIADAMGVESPVIADTVPQSPDAYPLQQIR